MEKHDPHSFMTAADTEIEGQAGKKTHVFHCTGRNPDTPSGTGRICSHPGTENKPFECPLPEPLSPGEDRRQDMKDKAAAPKAALPERAEIPHIPLVLNQRTFRLRHAIPAALISWMA